MTQATPSTTTIPTAIITSKTHPKGLYVLFATEMWERFNFYGMRALLVLFLAYSLKMGEKESSYLRRFPGSVLFDTDAWWIYVR
jgi:proton-dependent oligopeptide transporter, POT family